ncbi:MAG: dTDP-glucose 4,6-dehydratase [Candidatus Saganbacteria bacterium]|nr:dTDP-glucose 4,6-dehydratase [Candidatus Saganbacteria bacterium]
MKKILVTGGAGFIGSNFIRYYLAKHADSQIINLDKLTYARNLDNLRDLSSSPGYKFVKGDICNKGLVERIVSSGVDAIINFAAETHVDRSILSPDEFIKTDVLGTKVLLEAVKKYKVGRYVQISTDEVYGSIKKGSFTEESSIKPNSPYSASKAGGDLLVRAYYKTYGLPVIITRSSNNFGPNQYPEKLIPFFITQALADKQLPLYGDGKNVRNWIYVEDNCRALELILRKGKAGEVYNIGGGVEVQNIKIARTILKKLKKPKDLIKFVNDRPGHDRRYSLNSSKIKRLGWKVNSCFDDRLDETIDWYLDNQKWWQRLLKKQDSFKSSWYKSLTGAA